MARIQSTVSDGLRVRQARDAAIEKWLQEEVVPAYHELHNDPSIALSVDEARAALAQRRRQRA